MAFIKAHWKILICACLFLGCVIAGLVAGNLLAGALSGGGIIGAILGIAKTKPIPGATDIRRIDKTIGDLTKQSAADRKSVETSGTAVSGSLGTLGQLVDRAGEMRRTDAELIREARSGQDKEKRN